MELLESDNIVGAHRCASALEEFNRDRQEQEQKIYQDACGQIERGLAWQSPYSLLVAGRNWHQGVIGIVASRLARDYNRPTIVLTIQDDHAYGSGRSIANLNLVEVLTKSAPLLERYGGHPMAVGIGLKTENIAAFYEEMDREIKAQIDPSELESFISYDGEAQLGEMTPEFFSYLDKLSPFGHSNQKPVYRFNDVRVIRCSPVGQGQHTRGVLQNRTGQIEFIAFNRPVSDFSNRMLDVLATPQLNKRQPDSPPQLNIIDYRDVY